jgi:hypothetical protein
MLSLLQEFSASSPEKYYSKEAYNTYYNFLSESLRDNKTELLQFLIDKEETISISYKLLKNINDKPIHECEVKSTDAVFIDENVNYNYLQLLEGVLLVYIQLISCIQFVRQGKQPIVLDLYNCIEKLKSGKFNYLQSIYENNVRNGIGHGKVIYWESKAEYIDKKDNKATLYYNNFIRKFDLLLDVVNGFTLAYITFWNKELDALGVGLPRQILFEEVRLNSTTSSWEVVSVINQQILEKRQLAIEIISRSLSKEELYQKAILTAIHAARLVVDRFDIVYLHITHNNFPGFIKFSVEAINSIDHTCAGNQEYSSAVMDSLELFLNGFTENMPASMDSNGFKKVLDYNANPIVLETVGLFAYKDIKQHVNPYNEFILVKNACYVYHGVDSERNKTYHAIKSALPNLLAHARRKSKELTANSNHPQMPIRYLCIAIYEQDKRGRELRNNGIKPNLICTIQYNVTNVTGNIKLMDSRVEKFKDVLINWNHYWKNNEEYERLFPD